MLDRIRSIVENLYHVINPQREPERVLVGTYQQTDHEYITGTGQKLVNVHDPSQCEGHNCPIHNPSLHALRERPTHWREDRGLMERICIHGVGHPDPDHIDFVRRTLGEDAAWGESVHGCDGCCAEVGLHNHDIG